MFERGKDIDPRLKSIAEKLSRKTLAEALVKYLDQHSEVQAVFFHRSGGRRDLKRTLGQHGEKFLGNFMFDNRWEVMNKAITFPAMFGDWPKNERSNPLRGWSRSRWKIRKAPTLLSR